MANGRYHLVWEDTFSQDGPIDSNKWEFDIGTGNNGWGNNEKQYYTNRMENARCERQRLIIEARLENYNNQRFTSARLKSKSSWTYGRLQAKVKLPSGRGLWPAIWMLPENKSYGNAYWPDNGEIDIMEQVGYDPNRIVSSVHTAAFNHMKHTHPTHSVHVPDACDNFKIYTLNWFPDKLEMFVGNDSNPFEQQILIWNKDRHNWKGWPFDKNFFIVLNIAIGGNWGEQKGIDESIFPKRMEIEWIRFYQNSNDNIPISLQITSRVIALRSNANGKFVSANHTDCSLLIANSDSITASEKFDLIEQVEGKFAFRSHGNGKYVCTENGGNGLLIANSSEIKTWETFQIIDLNNGKVALMAINGKYVCAENCEHNVLIANRSKIDKSETFDLIQQ